MQDVFIIGAKGIGNYGGYETFLKRLIETDKNNKDVKYHIACKYNGQGAMDEAKLPNAQTIDDHHFTYYNADCFKIDVPEVLGAAQAVYYDIVAFRNCIYQIRKQKIQHPIVYILTCRIGPFIGKYVRQIHKLKGKVFVNPDGHEWMRAKWSKPVQKYWKISEKEMIKYADLVVCDSINIQNYIKNTYAKFNPNTTFIAYGADIDSSKLTIDSPEVINWYSKFEIKLNNYFLVVARFVPENNLETIIKEFVKSNVDKDLVIITNVENNAFFYSLKKSTHFERDKRIKFVGTVYNAELLKFIRQNAFAYIHGHSVGGTNPSLLEALGSTKLNLLYDIGFNKEVAKKSALYWNKSRGSLKELIEYVNKFSEEKANSYARLAKNRIRKEYSWGKIAEEYQNIFLK